MAHNLAPETHPWTTAPFWVTLSATVRSQPNVSSFMFHQTCCDKSHLLMAYSVHRASTSKRFRILLRLDFSNHNIWISTALDNRVTFSHTVTWKDTWFKADKRIPTTQHDAQLLPVPSFHYHYCSLASVLLLEQRLELPYLLFAV